jgi:PelA/Pel-15E family pectate lyase
MKLISLLVAALFASLSLPAGAAIIGTNVPANPLTLERIATLPAAEQPAWKEYLARSERQKLADQNVLWSEMKALGLKQSLTPPADNSASSVSLDEDAAWYGGDAARREADIIISFQTPAGGWSKNLNMAEHRRAPGEAFATDNNNRFSAPGDYDQAADMHWHYVGTFDNDATITQLRFLAKVANAVGTNAAPYRAAFQRGLAYSFNAQYPNGGWPQVWPLEGGYHDTITLNDDAMLHVLSLMNDIAQGSAEFAWVPAEARAQAAGSFQRGLACLLAAQIREPNGRRTVWCQQHDALTLQPASARNYEMPSAVSSESATAVLFLMQLPHPDSNVVAAVRAAAAWFDKTKIMDQSFTRTGTEGRRLVALPGAGPIWARYYELGTDRPIFGDRDKTIHDDVNELSLERRNGYGWYRNAPKRVLEHYQRWSQDHGDAPQNGH